MHTDAYLYPLRLRANLRPLKETCRWLRSFKMRMLVAAVVGALYFALPANSDRFCFPVSEVSSSYKVQSDERGLCGYSAAGAKHLRAQAFYQSLTQTCALTACIFAGHHHSLTRTASCYLSFRHPSSSPPLPTRSIFGCARAPRPLTKQYAPTSAGHPPVDAQSRPNLSQYLTVGGVPAR